MKDVSNKAGVFRGVALISLAVAVGVTASPASAGPLRTGFVDDVRFGHPATQERSFDRVRAAGGSVVRLVLYWNSVSPGARPSPFDPTNPADPAYRWEGFDMQVRAAAARGLDPIISIYAAPAWASEGTSGTVRPDPEEFGNFARAAARRYSGTFIPPGAILPLPRVRHWQAWNEPNRDYFLMPQYENGRMTSPDLYRRMVRAFSAAVKSVDRANRVVAGGLAPLGRPGKPAPLKFMREFFCLSRSLTRTCDLRGNPLPVDVWSHHPYTSGGPTHRARGLDNIALGDLPDMRRVLRAAVRAGHVRSQGPIGFWATEFSWDSKPPDPQGLPASLHARWTSEALFRMWQNGVTVVTWFRIQDDSMRDSYYQSGFWTAAGAAKRSRVAYRFPVVALRRSSGVYVWGRTPTGRSGNVAVEIKTGRSWRRLGTVRANAHGIFVRTFRTGATRGFVRAKFGGEVALPFSLTYVRDRYVNPFGCGGPIRC